MIPRAEELICRNFHLGCVQLMSSHSNTDRVRIQWPSDARCTFTSHFVIMWANPGVRIRTGLSTDAHVFGHPHIQRSSSHGRFYRSSVRQGDAIEICVQTFRPVSNLAPYTSYVTHNANDVGSW